MKNIKDIFLQKEYGQAYEKHMNGLLEQFSFKKDYGEIFVQYIKREIPYKLDGTLYYDLITPYGYGGPIIVNCKDGYEDLLVKSFAQEFTQYCKRQNIICEFVCFHPLLHNAEAFSSIYTLSHLRTCIFTNLIGGDSLNDEFHPKVRRCIHRSLDQGVTYEFITDITPKDIDDFIDIYYSNMDLVHSNSFYYFPKSYFESLITSFPKQILLIRIRYKDLTIGMDFDFLSFPYLYSHLGGTRAEYSFLFPSAMANYAAALYGQNHGYQLLFHGCGLTNHSDDGLFRFKRKFTKTGLGTYAQSARIINPEIYDKLVSMHKNKTSDNFFPAYRT